ncbi:MAG TPA: HAMP domain-containing sensor histidine kinase [Mycobacteriales bacterium]|nr:HAMP domain-containing sensor histidine kinase [Mycobacteriales bacterium]
MHPLRRMSLRGRLLLASVLLLVTGLAATSYLLVNLLRGHLVTRVDDQIRPIATVIARIPELSVPAGGAGLPGMARLDLVSDTYVGYLGADGRILRTQRTAGRESSPGPDLPRLDPAAVAAHGGRPFTVPGQAGTSAWRMVVLPYRPGESLGTGAIPPPGGGPGAGASPGPGPGGGAGGGGSVVVGASLNEVDSTVGQLRDSCVVIGLAVTALLAGVGWVAVQAGLRPLRTIEQTAAAVAAGDLTRRIPPLTAPRSEVGRLSAAINGMLGQIEAGFAARDAAEARMRRFVADASHELRTPLAGIRGFAELHRMAGSRPTGGDAADGVRDPGPGRADSDRADSDRADIERADIERADTGRADSGRADSERADIERAETDRSMRRIETEAVRLSGLVEDLLLLAQLDEQASATGTPLQRAPMDLRTLAADALHDLRALDPTRPVEFVGPDGGPPGDAPVLGDEARLRQVVTNLVGNAVTHTEPGTPTRIVTGTSGAEAFLGIEDSGPGLTSEQADRVFERFYRADRSRSRQTGGGGLGLAIAASLVAAHGGRMELRTAPGQGAAFRVLLPLLDHRTA